MYKAQYHYPWTTLFVPLILTAAASISPIVTEYTRRNNMLTFYVFTRTDHSLTFLYLLLLLETA